MQKILLIIVAAFYFVPVCKLVLLILRNVLSWFVFSKKLSKINLLKKQDNKFLKVIKSVVFFVSKLEYYIQIPRFYLVGMPVLIGSVAYMGMLFFKVPEVSINGLIFLVFYSYLVLWHVRQKRITDLRMTQFIKLFPNVHPEVFFNKYQLELAFGGVDFFHCDEDQQIEVANANFKQGVRPEQKILTLIRAFVDTATICHICLTGLKVMGPVYLKSYADKLGALIGKRVLQLSQAKFTMQGIEKLTGKKGRFLLIFNHKSAFDFILTYFALSEVVVNNRQIKPRFILAQDHFKDNWFIYSFIGMGKLAEAVDMVFVSRKDRRKSFKNLKYAAQSLIEKDIDIAIYPQGTRAEGNFDRAFKRRDSGFYTTVRKKDLGSPLAHIKKGTPYLILDALDQMATLDSTEELHLVFIGINGTGIALPKGCLKIQTEGDIEFKIGDVFSLSPGLLNDYFSESMSKEEMIVQKKQFVRKMSYLINKKLVEVLDLRQHLLQRFLTEIRGQFRFDDEKITLIKDIVLKLSEEGDLVYQILDRIYSLPIPQWNCYLSQLSQLLLERTTEERLRTLLLEISEEFMKRK